MAEFRFIAGLGNPGPEYERTRHNIGFTLIDELAAKCGRASWRTKQGAASAEVEFEGRRITLIKPQEYMNLSGPPIARIVQFVKAEPSELIVVYDDIDLPFGSIRIREDGSDGGHRGIRSIIEVFGTDKIVRLKLGVGRPDRGASGSGASGSGASEVRDWVLDGFSKEERSEEPAFLEKGIDALRCLVSGGVKKAQNKFNVKVKPKTGQEPAA